MFPVEGSTNRSTFNNMFNTGLLSSHALSNIASFSQDILVIGNGKVSAQYLPLAIAPRLRNPFILYLSLSPCFLGVVLSDFAPSFLD